MRTRLHNDQSSKRLTDDVFRHIHKLRIPKKAYIAGAGPGLQQQLAMLPDDAFVIACNSAILLDYPYRLWMVYDPGAWKFPWFNRVHPEEPLRVFGEQIRYYHDAHADALGLQRLDMDYSWQHRPVSRHTQPILDGVLCGGGTISCCALQLLFWAGCEHAVLCGVPMKGMKHFDGSKASHLRTPWHQARAFNKVIRACEAKGMQVTSAGETALEVKVSL